MKISCVTAIKKRTNVEQYITELTEEKKKAEKEIAVIQKILSLMLIIHLLV